MAYNLVGHDHGPLRHAVDAAPEAPPKAWIMPLALLLAAGAAALTVWNVTRIIHGPPAPPVPTPVAAKQALYLGVMKLEAFRRVHGAAPDTMMEAGLAAGSGYVYTRVDAGHYVLAFEDRSARQTYDSTTPMAAAFGPAKEMFALGTNGDAE
jgi:hypothetical protein